MIENIGDSDLLYRRLAPVQVDPDGRANSSAYKRQSLPDQSISVDLARLTTPEQALMPVQGRGFGLGVIEARLPRELGFAVRHDPLPENPAHCLIEGDNSREKCRRLAEATWVIRPPRQQTPL